MTYFVTKMPFSHSPPTLVHVQRKHEAQTGPPFQIKLGEIIHHNLRAFLSLSIPRPPFNSSILNLCASYSIPWHRNFCPAPNVSVPCLPGFYCPSNTAQPTLCCKGYLCSPDTKTIEVCPEGFFCPIASTKAVSCASRAFFVSSTHILPPPPSSSHPLPSRYFLFSSFRATSWRFAPKAPRPSRSMA